MMLSAFSPSHAKVPAPTRAWNSDVSVVAVTGRAWGPPPSWRAGRGRGGGRGPRLSSNGRGSCRKGLTPWGLPAPAPLGVLASPPLFSSISWTPRSLPRTAPQTLSPSPESLWEEAAARPPSRSPQACDTAARTPQAGGGSLLAPGHGPHMPGSPGPGQHPGGAPARGTALTPSLGSLWAQHRPARQRPGNRAQRPRLIYF